MNFETVLALIGIVLGSNGLWTFILKKFDKKSADHKLLIALAHDRIYGGSIEAISRGFITRNELENLSELYEAYEAAGGNGTGTSLYKKAASLPLKKEEE